MTSICYKYNTFPQYMNAKNMLRSHGLIGNSANSGKSKENNGVHFGNPTNGNLSDGNLIDGNSADGNSADGNSADGNSADSNSADSNSANSNSADNNSANRKSSDQKSANGNSIGGNSAIGNVADGNSAKGDSISSNEFNYNDLFEDDYEKLHSNRSEMCDLNVAKYEPIETKSYTYLINIVLIYHIGFNTTLGCIEANTVVINLGTIHKRRLPIFTFLGIPALPLSPHVSFVPYTP